MARLPAIAVMFAMGCGRFGFDDRPLADAEVPIDGPAPLTCPAARVPGVDLGPQAPVIALAGTGTPLGYALAVQRGDASAVDGLVVAADLSAATPSSPGRSTPIEGVSTTYARVVLQWDGARILGGLVTDGGTFFWKIFPDTMGTFTSAIEETPPQQPAAPFFATVDGLPHAVSYAGPQLTIWELDGNGVPTGVFTGVGFGDDITSAGVVPRDAAASIGIVETAGIGIVATELANAAPPPFEVDPAGTRPVVTGTSTQVHVTYLRGSELVARTIDSSSLQVSSPRVVTTTMAGFYDSAMRDEQLRVVWSDATGFHIGLDGAPFATIDVSGLPTDPPDTWTVVERGSDATVFVAYGDALWSIPICY